MSRIIPWCRLNVCFPVYDLVTSSMMNDTIPEPGRSFTTCQQLLKWVFVGSHFRGCIQHIHQLWCSLFWKLDDGCASWMQRRHLISNTTHAADLPLWTYNPWIYTPTKAHLKNLPSVVKHPRKPSENYCHQEWVVSHRKYGCNMHEFLDKLCW